MKFAKGVVRALEKGKDLSNDKGPEIPILPLVPEDGEYDEEDGSKCGSFKLLSNPADAASAKYSFRMGYADGSQSVRFHIQWAKNVLKVLRGLAITTGPNQLQMVNQMCLGDVLTSFQDSVRRFQDEARVIRATTAADALGAHDPTAETQAEWEARREIAYRTNVTAPVSDPTTAMVTMSARFAAGSVLPYKALERQKRFMRRKMRKPVDMKIRQYVSHLTRINSDELPHMPPFLPDQQLSGDEILDIVMFGIPKSWEKEMAKQDFDPFRNGATLRQLVEFCERLEAVEDTPTVQRNNTTTSNKKTKFQGNKGKTIKPEGKWCAFHESNTHDTSECTVLKKMKDAKKNGNEKSFHNNNNDKPWAKKSNDAKKFTKKELNNIVKKASDKAYKKAKKELNSVAKRKKSDDDDESVESLNAIDKINREMNDVDAQLKQFEFNSENEVEV